MFMLKYNKYILCFVVVHIIKSAALDFSLACLINTIRKKYT